MSVSLIKENCWSFVSTLLLIKPSNFGQNLPYVAGSASSSGIYTTGTLSLSNTVGTDYGPDSGFGPYGGFDAGSNSQNVATDPSASIMSSTSVTEVIGNSLAVPYDSNQWNFVATGNTYTNANIGTGNVQDQNQATVSHQIDSYYPPPAVYNAYGQSQSHIQGSGTDMNLSSTSTAQVAPQLLPPLPPLVRALNKKGSHRDLTIEAYPNSQSSSYSSGTAPSGVVVLANNDQLTYNYNTTFYIAAAKLVPSGDTKILTHDNTGLSTPTSGFSASAMTQNTASESGASIQSAATASSQTGHQGLNIISAIGNGSAATMGSELTGNMQNQNQAQGWNGNSVMGVAQSNNAANGTQLQLSSAANSAAESYPSSIVLGPSTVAPKSAGSLASVASSAALKSKVGAPSGPNLNTPSHVALIAGAFRLMLRRRNWEGKPVRARSSHTVRTAVRQAESAIRKTQVVNGTDDTPETESYAYDRAITNHV